MNTRRRSTGLGIFVAISLAAALTMHASVADARAIGGVGCNGGFFVNAPDKRIFWVEDAQSRKTVVHDGRDKLVVLAECGTGVVSAFKDHQNPNLVRAFYSPDCKSISTAAGTTEKIIEKEGSLAQLNVNDNGVSLVLKSGEEVASNVCGSPTD